MVKAQKVCNPLSIYYRLSIWVTEKCFFELNLKNIKKKKFELFSMNFSNRESKINFMPQKLLSRCFYVHKSPRFIFISLGLNIFVKKSLICHAQCLLHGFKFQFNASSIIKFNQELHCNHVLCTCCSHVDLPQIKLWTALYHSWVS